RTVVRLLGKRAEKGQRRTRFDGLPRLRHIVHPVPPRAAAKNTVTLCRGCECEVVHTSRRFRPSKVRHTDIGSRRCKPAHTCLGKSSVQTKSEAATNIAPNRGRGTQR